MVGEAHARFQGPGARSLFSAVTLIRMGYTDVVAMTGGLKEWIGAGVPVEESDERRE